MQVTNEATVSQEETVGTTFPVPLALWKRLKVFATERRVSTKSLWLQAMTEYLDREA